MTAVTTEHVDADGARLVPCARYAGLAAAQFVHPEGVCACFRGGPPPMLLPVPMTPPDAHDLLPPPVLPRPRSG